MEALNVGVTEFQTNLVPSLRIPVCFAAARRHLRGQVPPCTAEPRARASHLLTYGISA